MIMTREKLLFRISASISFFVVIQLCNGTAACWCIWSSRYPSIVDGEELDNPFGRNEETLNNLLIR